MSTGVEASYYDGLTSKPLDARVQLREPDALEIELNGERVFWPLEHGGMRWERSSSVLRITFGEHPRKVLIVRDALFISSFAKRMQYAGRRGAYDRILSLARQGPILFFLGVVIVLVLGYVWVLPFAAERMALLLPSTVDRQLGKAAIGSILLGMEEDSARSASMQRFGDQLSLSEHFELRFHVVRNDQVNAFAMPGGDIVVFTGILDEMEHPEQLAALLAHEAAHVEERHSTRMVVRQIAGYVFISLLLGDVNAIVAVAAENADNLRDLSYSRALESDADRMGMDLMHRAGVDPNGMIQLLELLQNQALEMPEELGFLSSHPLTEKRIEAARERANAYPEMKGGLNILQEEFRALKATPSPDQ